MDDNRSTPLEQLRARVEALEAQANHIPDATKMVPPPVATDEELADTWHKTPGVTDVSRRRALYNLGVTHGQAGSREVAELRAELERERIRLAACGVVAKADTPESAKEARDMHPDYHSASDLRYSRRPKPPSLKEQALEGFERVLSQLYSPEARKVVEAECKTILLALEGLPND
jgi:hypothetical protein